MHARGMAHARAWLAAALLSFLAPALVLAEALPPGPASGWADQLTVYAIPAPRKIKWGSPRKLFLRALGNQIAFRHRDSKHSIGHVFVHLRSSLTGREEFVGMTSRGPTEDRDLILLDGYGFGVLGADMMGRLETHEELAARLEERAETGLIAWLRFGVSPEAAARMVEFVDEFRAQGLDDHYGGANRPRYREGGGCSAFGLAFMELAGLVTPEHHEAWQVHFRVPERLWGGPLTGLRVPLRRALWEGGRWARADEPHVASMFWDPSKMYRWIRENHEAQALADHAPESYKDAVGLVVDARATPVPAEPIWLEDPAGQGNPYGRQESVRREEEGALPLSSGLGWPAAELAELFEALGDPIPFDLPGALPLEADHPVLD